MTDNDHITSALSTEVIIIVIIIIIIIIIIICYRPSDRVKIDRIDSRDILARYRTSDLSDFQNAVACKGYTSVLSKMV